MNSKTIALLGMLALTACGTNNGGSNNGGSNNGGSNNGGSNNGGSNNGGTNNGGTNNGGTNNGGTNNGGTNNGGTNNGANNGQMQPITVEECFELSLDPDDPLAIDGVFGPDSTFWRRPHAETLTCPASGYLPDDQPLVPYVAFSFCNNDTVEHAFDIEVLVYEGPNAEPALDDPVLFVYDGQGVPVDYRQCLAVNDDIPDAIDATDSLIEGLVVQPGQAITTVPTSFQYSEGDGWGTGYYVLVVTNAD